MIHDHPNKNEQKWWFHRTSQLFQKQEQPEITPGCPLQHGWISASWMHQRVLAWTDFASASKHTPVQFKKTCDHHGTIVFQLISSKVFQVEVNPRFSHWFSVFPLVFLWIPVFSHGFPSFPWFSRVFPWFSHGFCPTFLTIPGASEGCAAARGGPLRRADDQRRDERGASGGEDAEGGAAMDQWSFTWGLSSINSDFYIFIPLVYWFIIYQ